ncbi:MAG: histidine kinase N-terminal 7TM domain-containing protein [Eubacteriales bacterium]
MEKTNLKRHSVFIYAAVAVIAAVVLRQIGFGVEGALGLFCNILRSVIYIGLFTSWGISVSRRVIQPQVRRYLTAISVLMVFWVSLRTIRYMFTVEPLLLRYLWYLYYLPMLFIPFLAVFVALSLGKSESYRLPKWTTILFIPATVLLLLVLTNDFHQLVFAFSDSSTLWRDDYHYAMGYFFVVGWLILCALTAIVTMLIKCRVPNSRKVFVLPFVPVILALIYGILYVFRVPWLKHFAGDMTVVFCLFFAATLEICIQCGLIQTNTGYGKLFEIGTIGAQITDAEYHTRYASSNAIPLSPDMKRAAEKGSVSIDKNTLLKSSPISGGHVLWQEDITEISALLERLEENRKTIEDSNCLEEENIKTKVKINTIREQNRLYDRFQQQTAKQINLLDGILNRYEAENDPDIARSLLAKIGVIGAYIKRRGNLIFIEEKAEVTDTAELSACLEESFTGLKFMDVECALDIPEGHTIPVNGAARVYDFFEAVTETVLDDLRSVWLKGRVLENAIVFCIEVESDTDLTRFAELADSVFCEDGVWRFTLRIGKAGETS